MFTRYKIARSDVDAFFYLYYSFFWLPWRTWRNEYNRCFYGKNAAAVKHLLAEYLQAKKAKAEANKNTKIYKNVEDIISDDTI